MQRPTGEVVFTKKIASNNIGLIQRALDFEIGYKNDQNYAIIPNARSGYNSLFSVESLNIWVSLMMFLYPAVIKHLGCQRF